MVSRNCIYYALCSNWYEQVRVAVIFYGGNQRLNPYSDISAYGSKSDCTG